MRTPPLLFLSDPFPSFRFRIAISGSIVPRESCLLLHCRLSGAMEARREPLTREAFLNGWAARCRTLFALRACILERTVSPPSFSSLAHLTTNPRAYSRNSSVDECLFGVLEFVDVERGDDEGDRSGRTVGRVVSAGRKEGEESGLRQDCVGNEKHPSDQFLEDRTGGRTTDCGECDTARTGSLRVGN
jgi:hypothetical protein